MGGRGSSSGGASGGASSSKGERLYSQLKSGQTLHLQNPDNGKKFEVHTKTFAGVTGYFISQNGKAVPGYKGGRIMPKSEAVSWLSGLKEI